MFSSPNMLDVHNANLSFWSPQPYFIAGFFFPQQLFQLAWLYRLYKLDPKKPVERTELDQIGTSLEIDHRLSSIKLTNDPSRLRALLCPRECLHRQYMFLPSLLLTSD